MTPEESKAWDSGFKWGLSVMAICVMLTVGLSGCSVTESWMRSYVAVHDAADTVLAGKTNPPTAAIPPISADQYNGGTPSDGGHQFEVWQHNWHGMNIRVHCNPGELRNEYGIPTAGGWYPLDMSRMPSDIVTMTKTATGATFTAKDFTAGSGQRYRFEGFRADKIGTLSKVYTLTLSDAQMGGALMVWYATVK